MRYIECPEIYEKESDSERSIFLAGGITGCPNWQQDIAKLLSGTGLALLNPRRKNFPINDVNASNEQILWEYHHLRKADIILFWFPKESDCPIALYELGAWANTSKPLFIGMHPQYPRRIDVEVQISLIKPDFSFHYSTNSLATEILKTYGKR
jgi:hypothetical protein